MLSTKDRDRLKVLHEVKGEHLTQRAAAQQLGISDRWVRALLGRVKQEGDRGVVHRLRGRVSNRRLPEKVRTKALELVQTRYGDFGPTLACEYLAKKHEVEVSKETLRKWLIGAGLRRVKRRQVEEVHVWRPRRSCRGELVQWDTSEHDWLEGRGPKLYLVAMIDDATSQAYARFVEHDSTEANLRVLWGYLERWGRPVAFYTDKGSVFRVNKPVVEASDDEAVKEETTQIGRALKELGIGWIAAHSPQAKGRIERSFGTAQDRLVKGLRIAKAARLEEANRYLEQEYLPLWNGTFTAVAESPTDAHRPLRREHDLAAILSQVEARVVTPDYTIRYQGKIYQIARADIRAGLRGGRVRVEQRLDGSLAVKFRERYLNTTECQPRPKTPAPPKPATTAKKAPTKAGRAWMKDFNLQKSPPLWAIVEGERATLRREMG
ncbi:MAG TPA: ISNCY family transposase [Terriglobia bacterium]|nr:ISNCY family transposase [Terriglobia bacterium]